MLEFRHPSFASDEAIGLLREHDIGCVIADTAGRWPYADAITSNVVYVRLHGPDTLYHGGYDAALLDSWAARCRTWSRDADVFVFFDNDADGRAPHDAMALIDRLGSPLGSAPSSRGEGR